MVQLDLEKAYDHVNWSFVSGLMHTMGILNLSKHMMARRFSLLQDMCSNSQSWISIAQYFIEKKALTHGRTKIEASWWQLLNGCICKK